MNKRIVKFCVLLTLYQFGLSSIAQASIYKCVDVEGSVFYIDKPCPVNHQEESIKHIEDPKNTAHKMPLKRSSVAVLPQVLPSNNGVKKRDSHKATKTEAVTVSQKVDGFSEGSNTRNISPDLNKVIPDTSNGNSFAENTVTNTDITGSETSRGEVVNRLSRLRTF